MSHPKWHMLSATLALAVWSCGEGPTSPSGDLQTITPATALAGSPDLTLTLRGVDFVTGAHQGSRVVWTANDRNTFLATTFVSSSELTAVVPSALLITAGNAQVFVETGDPMGDLPLHTSNKLPFTVVPETGSGTADIVVYGRTSALPPKMKGSRDVALDGSGWRTLHEADSLRYSRVAAGTHQLMLSNPCTGSHQPSLDTVTAVAASTVTVPVYIPPDCE